MNSNLEKKLVEKYSEFFSYLNCQEKNGLIMPIVFGFECGDGWYNILDILMDNIQNYIKWNHPEMVINITQIKEKFGGLRFYYDGGDDYVDGLVSMAESLADKTCEFCGSMKNVGKTTGWITTLCKKCYEEKASDKTWKQLEE